MKILLIDDFRISNEILSNVLSENDYEVFHTQNPDSVLTALKKEPFDLIITDYQMPKMNGIDLMLEIRKIKGLERQPVIILSAIKKTEIKKDAYKKGVTAWIEKPVTKETTAKIIKFINKLNIEK